jgi:hypothetical protein
MPYNCMIAINEVKILEMNNFALDSLILVGKLYSLDAQTL